MLNSALLHAARELLISMIYLVSLRTLRVSPFFIPLIYVMISPSYRSKMISLELLFPNLEMNWLLRNPYIVDGYYVVTYIFYWLFVNF